MTNRAMIAQAISSGITDKSAILERVLADDTAGASGSARRACSAHRGTVWQGAAGWACSACLLALSCVGYFSGTISIGTGESALQTAGASSSMAEAGTFDAADEATLESPPMLAFVQEAEPEQAQFAPVQDEAAVAPAEKPPEQEEVWIITKDETPAVEEPYQPKIEIDTSDNSSDSWTSGSASPPVPDNGGNKPGKPGDGSSNPDTGGGDENVREVPYLQFTTNNAYRMYWDYIPRDLAGFTYFPFVSCSGKTVDSAGQAEVSYGNPNGLSKQVYSIGIYGDPEQGLPLITDAAQITEALLRSINTQHHVPPEALMIEAPMNLRGRTIRFYSQSVTYQQAVQILQSLPVLNGGNTP